MSYSDVITRGQRREIIGMSAPETVQSAVSTTDVYYDVVASRLDEQLHRIDAIDAKASTIFASASAILVVFAGLVTLSATLPSHRQVPWWVVGGIIVASCTYVWLLFNLFHAFRVSRWFVQPELNTLEAHCLNEDNDVELVKRWVANERKRAIKDNEPHVQRKAKWVHLGLIALSIEALLLILTGIVALVTM